MDCVTHKAFQPIIPETGKKAIIKRRKSARSYVHFQLARLLDEMKSDIQRDDGPGSKLYKASSGMFLILLLFVSCFAKPLAVTCLLHGQHS